MRPTGFRRLMLGLAVAVIGLPQWGYGQNDAPAAVKPAEEERNISFSFKDKPWEDVVEWLAELTGRTLLIEDPPTGSFNYVDSKKYTLTEALDIINSVLLNKGYVILRRDNFLVVTEVQSIPAHLVPTVTTKDLPNLGKTEFVKVLLTLEGLLAEEAKTEFEKMLEPHGRILPLKSTNQLLIIGAARSVEQVVKLIVDNQTSEVAGEMRAFKLNHVRAREVERVVRDMLGLAQREVQQSQSSSSNRSSSSDPRRRFMEAMMRGRFGGGDRSRSRGGDDDGNRSSPGGPPSFPGAPGGSTTTPEGGKGPFVSVDERTNTLFVTATPDKLAMVSSVVNALDVAQEGDNEVPQLPRIEVYPVEAGTAEGLKEVISEVFKSSAETRVSAHPDGRALIVYAIPSEHERIEGIISQIKTEGLKIEVIPLRYLDAGATATLIKSLFGQKEDEQQNLPFFFRSRSRSSSNEEEEETGPVVEADTDRNRLLVRGTQPQIDEVRAMLAKLGETGVAFDGGVDRSRYRVLRLGERDPKDVAEAIQRIWKNLGQKDLNVEILGDDQPRTNQPALEAPPGSLRSLPGSVEPPASSTERESDEADPLIDKLRKMSTEEREKFIQEHIPKFLHERVRQRLKEDAAVNGASVLESIQAEEEIPADSDGAKPAQVQEDEAPPARLDRNVTPAQTQTPADAPSRPQSQPDSSPVTILIGPDNIAIAGNDPAKLDLLEQVLNSVLGTGPGGDASGFMLHYLKTADAEEMAGVVEEALYGQRNAFSTTDPTTEARIIPDTRNNALLVVGPRGEQRKVQQILEVLDKEAPESDVQAQPRKIPVQFANAESVATVVKEVFAADLYNPQGRNQQQQRGGFPSFFGGGSRNRNQNSTGKLTVSVDEQTNSIFVSAPQVLYLQVLDLVEVLDEDARGNAFATEIIELRNAYPEAVQRALKNLYGVQTGEEKAAAAKKKAEEDAKNKANQNNNNDEERRSRFGGFGGGDRGRSRGGFRR